MSLYQQNPYQGFADSFLSALSNKRAREQKKMQMDLIREDRKVEAERRRMSGQANEAYGAAVEGVEGAEGALATLSPELHQKFMATRARHGQEALSTAEAIRKQEAEKLRLTDQVTSKAVQYGPQAVPALIKRLQGTQLWDDSPQELEQLGQMLSDPESAQQLAQSIPGMGKMIDDPGMGANFAEVAGRMNIPVTEWGSRRGEISEELQRMRQSEEATAKKRAENPLVNIGSIGNNQPLEKTVRKMLQTDLIENKEKLMSIQKVRALADPKFFTLLGRAKNKGASLVAKLDPSLLTRGATMDLQQRSTMFLELEQGFDAYRKDITGAQAAMMELERLRGHLVNPDMSWPEFQAALDQYQSKLMRAVRIKRKVLRENLDLSPEQVDERHSELYLEATTTANSYQDQVARLTQLEEMGVMEPMDQTTMLLAEGYITQEKANKLFDKYGKTQ